ncbi:MAG: SoxW family protein [Wolinella sp.]
MIRKFYILSFTIISFLFSACEDSSVSADVISQGTKMSEAELRRIDNLDRASYAELADIILDNNVINPNGRYLMMIFGSNGCIYCDKLKQEIRDNEDIKVFIKEHFSPYYINGSYSKSHTLVTGEHTTQFLTHELAQFYGIRPTPTIVFATPEGQTILTYPGYMPKERLDATLHFIAERLWEGAGSEKEMFMRLNKIYKEKDL